MIHIDNRQILATTNIVVKVYKENKLSMNNASALKIHISIHENNKVIPSLYNIILISCEDVDPKEDSKAMFCCSRIRL